MAMASSSGLTATASSRPRPGPSLSQRPRQAAASRPRQAAFTGILICLQQDSRSTRQCLSLSAGRPELCKRLHRHMLTVRHLVLRVSP